nr:MAG TPA: hypothetical protein [Caudoviricetes sp.]
MELIFVFSMIIIVYYIYGCIKEKDVYLLQYIQP